MSAIVQLRGMTKRFGEITAVDDFTLMVEPGEFLAVLGPSGCGKSTLLRSIAGFERIDGGQIALDTRLVAARGLHMAAHRRRVGVVPQEPALFAHLSVADNVGFGLSRAARRNGRAEECLELVGLQGLGGRMPHELSGGQQQRVSVARALAPRPPVVLLDEPFSALDASLRAELRRDVRSVLAEAGSTAILVTHDQNEALSMADRLAVMRDGRLRQIGTPAQVYREPADGWVAQFVGDAMLLPIEVAAEGLRCVVGELTVSADSPGLAPHGDSNTAFLDTVNGAERRFSNGDVLALIRPEQLRLVPEGRFGVPARVSRVDYHGHDAVIVLDLEGGTEVLMRVPDGPEVFVEPGQGVRIRVHGEVRAYPRQDIEAGTYAVD